MTDAEFNQAIGRRPIRPDAAAETAVRGKIKRQTPSRTTLVLAALSLMLLVDGCVCRPVHLSGSAPSTTKDLEASLP